MKTLSNSINSIPLSIASQIDIQAKDYVKRGKRIINFSVGEPDFDTPKIVCDSAKFAIDQGFTRYTHVAGMVDLRKTIADYIREESNINYELNEVVVTAGAKYAVFASLRILLNIGDEVILPAPYWTSYYYMICLLGAKPIIVNTTIENNWKIKCEDLESCITDKTKLIIFNNPNNPSGAVYSIEDQYKIAEIVEKYDLYVLSDEIYSKIVYTKDSFRSFPTISPSIKKRTLLINGLSKSFAMTGWRIGYVACDSMMANMISVFLSHSLGCTCSISQRAAITALTKAINYQSNIRDELLKKRDLVITNIRKIPDVCFSIPEGAFYIMLDISRVLNDKCPNDISFSYLLLKKYGVAVVPCADFGIKRAVRLSFALDDKSIVEGIERLSKFISNLQGSE